MIRILLFQERQLAHQDSEQALEQALTLKKELVNVQQQNKELGDALNEANEALEKAKQEQFETDTSTKCLYASSLHLIATMFTWRILRNVLCNSRKR